MYGLLYETCTLLQSPLSQGRELKQSTIYTNQQNNKSPLSQGRELKREPWVN